MFHGIVLKSGQDHKLEKTDVDKTLYHLSNATIVGTSTKDPTELYVKIAGKSFKLCVL